jgi:uncharacterized protein (TIGR01244 family)
MQSRTTLLATAVLLAAAAFAAATWAAESPTYGIANANFPEPGVLAAGQPTGEQLQLLAEDAYKTVIDLRLPEEPHGFDEVEAAKQNGLVYVNVPVTLATLDQATIDRFLEAFGKAQRPVLLHCTSSNRVGALYYAWLVLEKGVAPGEALRRGKAAGLHQPELIDKIQKLVAERRASARK